MAKKNVHQSDMLVVTPVHEGWCLRWYTVRDGDDGDADDDHLADPFPVESEAVADDSEVLEGFTLDERELYASDVRENDAVRVSLASSEGVLASETEDPEEEPAYFYWETKQQAELAADAAMAAVRLVRAAPRWARAALAAGWTPPPDWDDRG